MQCKVQILSFTFSSRQTPTTKNHHHIVLCLLCLYYACTMPTMPVLCLLCLYYAYYACAMPTMPVLCLYYAYYACTMPTMPVLCLLCLYYAYYACTMPTMPIYNYPLVTTTVSVDSLETRKNILNLIEDNLHWLNWNHRVLKPDFLPVR